MADSDTAAVLSALLRTRDDLIAQMSAPQSITDQNGEQVQSRTFNQIQAALFTINSEIARLTRPKPNTIRFRTSKGL
ncbi:hypothetical protein CFR73_09585 [Novacetimonas maltaceti]|uniref:Uncharacterized protein n=1 Tax=Novacetimonas maltaceti TaxID=1203393 RepID=A0A2S3W3V8_9PROT|nr:hypothetical protein [Novacetimonas maltaceti]POF63556.1 hypothetical protein KMAL_07360 [Novacetimonas maltaceti]PYD59829.1 hypothetical protein CFR73_09585 [Novacetimonas maltaceti]